MDIEQLKLILEMVSGLGDSAFTVALFWIGKYFLSMLLKYALFFFIVYKLFNFFYSLITNSSLKSQLEILFPEHVSWGPDFEKNVNYDGIIKDITKLKKTNKEKSC